MTVVENCQCVSVRKQTCIPGLPTPACWPLSHRQLPKSQPCSLGFICKWALRRSWLKKVYESFLARKICLVFPLRVLFVIGWARQCTTLCMLPLIPWMTNPVDTVHCYYHWTSSLSLISSMTLFESVPQSFITSVTSHSVRPHWCGFYTPTNTVTESNKSTKFDPQKCLGSGFGALKWINVTLSPLQTWWIIWSSCLYRQGFNP